MRSLDSLREGGGALSSWSLARGSRRKDPDGHHGGWKANTGTCGGNQRRAGWPPISTTEGANYIILACDRDGLSQQGEGVGGGRWELGRGAPGGDTIDLSPGRMTRRQLFRERQPRQSDQQVHRPCRRRNRHEALQPLSCPVPGAGPLGANHCNCYTHSQQRPLPTAAGMKEVAFFQKAAAFCGF